MRVGDGPAEEGGVDAEGSREDKVSRVFDADDGH